jgi:hypothetical protein
VEVVVRIGRRLLAIAVLTVVLAPSIAFAQAAAPSPASELPAGSNLWLVVGGLFTTLRGDCQECEGDYPYRHTGGIYVDAGRRLGSRLDVGLQTFWSRFDTAAGHINGTHLDAVASFRPWDAHGFFIKGGAGMALIRNWVDTIGNGAINSKALSVVIGAGWTFRPASRIGLQLVAEQYAAALGDLQTATGEVPDVMGNYWTLGAGIVIR